MRGMSKMQLISAPTSRQLRQTCPLLALVKFVEYLDEYQDDAR